MGFFDLGKGIIAKLHGEKVVLPSRLHEKDLVAPALYAEYPSYYGTAQKLDAVLATQFYSNQENILTESAQQKLKQLWEQEWLGGCDVDSSQPDAHLTVTSPSMDWGFVTTTSPDTSGVQFHHSGWFEITNETAQLGQPVGVTITLDDGRVYRHDGYGKWTPVDAVPEPEAPAETHVAPRRAMDLE